MTRTRTPVVIVLMISLIGAAVTRDAARSRRAEYQSQSGAGGGNSLSRLNSYSMALLLGGLRGPLVMMLWTSSEAQKADKNLEDFDTKVEWIRLLQPEFDTVHIFQIWNKAYNISVQMASLTNKYITILDAIDYAESVDKEHPDDINILESIGQVYFDKLGNSAEKNYYRPRVLEESRAHPLIVTLPASELQRLSDAVRKIGGDSATISATTSKAGQAIARVRGIKRPALEAEFNGTGISYSDQISRQLAKDDPAYRRRELDPVLDDNGNLLPDAEKEMPYLSQFAPYPYGVDPFGMAYSYFKRSERLQTNGQQRHAQLSDLVIDSRPGLTLKSWAEMDWERGRRRELDAYHQPSTGERADLEMPTAEIKPTEAPLDRAAVKEALYCYDMTDRLSTAALVEYERHLKLFRESESTYMSHIDTIIPMQLEAKADRDYLAATMAQGDEQAKLLVAARKEYNDAVDGWMYLIMRYYVDPGIEKQVFPPGVDRITNLKDVPAPLRRQLFAGINQVMQRRQDQFTEDRGEYDNYIHRCAMRLQQLPQ
jgi:hypothetical protein